MDNIKRTNQSLFQFLFITLICAGCAVNQSKHESASKLSPPSKQSAPSKSALKPVYAPLAVWLTGRYALENKKGIGIDLGSGSGDLIVELSKRSPGMHWINADISTKRFAHFFTIATKAGVQNRISAQYADAKSMPYRDNYADIVVSRGSFPFWGGIKAGLSEVQRILKPGGIAFIGRGFSENLPVNTARSIRERQRKNARFPHYNVDETEKELRMILQELGITPFKIHRPSPPGSEDVNYGIWVEWKK